MKVYALPAEEDWICDQLVEDFKSECFDIFTPNSNNADILWLLSDWKWKSIHPNILKTKKVVTTVHHIVPEKFDKEARIDFLTRDNVTDIYHVFNQRTYDFIRALTTKEIKFIPYWANDKRWVLGSSTKQQLREKYSLPNEGYLIGSFQRDTEGHDLKSPKLEKGPDLLADFLIAKYQQWQKDCRSKMLQPHVVLGGWRRQYVVSRLKAASVPYTYFERPPQKILNELYQTLDLYPVTARYEGGPQSIIECGLLNVPVISRPVGIAEQVLPTTAINENIMLAYPAIPNIENMKISNGSMNSYRLMFESLK